MKSNGNYPDRRGPTTLMEVDPDASAIEKAVVTGDLASLNSGQRLEWYQSRCEAAGLDPRTQPFEYLVLKGKLKLYATKAATDQLIAVHRLTTQIVARGYNRDISMYEVQCRVTWPDGHSGEDIGVVDVHQLSGEELANAIMKCVTKAKRRTVLSACGLGMLDETEVESIRGARRVTVSEAHGPNALAIEGPQHQPQVIERPSEPLTEGFYGDPKPKTSEPIKKSEMRTWIELRVRETNDWVASRWMIDHPDEEMSPTKVIENPGQIAQHFVTKWLEEGALEDADVLGPNGKRDRAKVGAHFAAWCNEDQDQAREAINEYLYDKRDKAARLLGIEPDEPSEIVAGMTGQTEEG